MSATDQSFKAAIPGSSLTYEKGSMPHQKPPKYTKPEEALEYFWKQLHQKEILKQIWHISEQGGTMFAMARAILYKAALSGVIQPNLAIVIYPIVQKMLIAIVQSKGIKPKIHPKLRSANKDAMMKDKIRDMIKQSSRKTGVPLPNTGGVSGSPPNQAPTPQPPQGGPPAPQQAGGSGLLGQAQQGGMNG